MLLFLITFLALYGGIHLYAFYKLRNAFPHRPYLKWPLILWMTFMTIIPLLVRVAEQFGMGKTALGIAWPGFIWMGFMFVFTSSLFFADIIHLLYRITPMKCSIRLPVLISTHTATKSVFLLAVLGSAYACIEAVMIQNEHVVIHSSKLPPSVSRIRIVQISDVHIGLLLGEWRLLRIMEKIREAKPDILISTGDLVDGKLNRDDAMSELDPLAVLLASVPAPSGKFAVIGNHEVYAGLPQALAFSGAAGFTILRNRSLQLANGISITGIDDRAATQKTVITPGNEEALLNSVPKDSFHLLLKHRPEIPPESDGRFDLQLSGHVHGGQIFPFNFLVRLRHPIPCGTTTTASGSQIHVSRGTGTWGPPMRLFAPPEVTVIDIVSQQQAK